MSRVGLRSATSKPATNAVSFLPSTTDHLSVSIRNGRKGIIKVEDSSTTNMSDLTRKQLSNIRMMRSSLNAPVDVIGCDKLFDPEAPHVDQRYQILISLMLSSQTKDTTNAKVMTDLKKADCTAIAISKMEESQLSGLIRPVSFYRTKAKHIKMTTVKLLEEHSGDVPSSIDELVALPGIGYKMGHLIMKACWHKVTGIAVDTHVHRISNVLGWIRTSTPEQSMKALEELFPRDEWADVNTLLVGFGQTICSAVKPNCQDCLNNDICPKLGLSKKGQKRK